MRLPAYVAMTIAAGIAGACSAVPDGITGSGTVSHPGYHGQGVYIPTGEELAYDCNSLAFMINKSVQLINAMPEQAKKQRDAAPTSVVHAVHRVSGGGIPVLDDYKRERAKLKALVEVSAQKKCPSIDAEAQTKAAADKLAAVRKG